MSETLALSSEDLAFLGPYLPPSSLDSPQHPDGPGAACKLPFTTLTYACSLDGRISLAPGTRTALSGPESKSLTHYLRLHHDAILIGVGTAIADNPGLNCRYPGATLEAQPRPVIVDPKARWGRHGEVVRLVGEGKGLEPWVLVGEGVEAVAGSGKLEGVEVLELKTTESQGARFAWREVFEMLAKRGVRNVMIEGGASVINDLLANERDIIDSVIVTVAPAWLGEGAVAASPAKSVAAMTDVKWRQFGADAVVCGRLPR
ncbi:hypothetical protein B0A48_00315 [Cryoendolithus antarcticus]|uniref:2,5-diamino-6-ribosylamino-4(3H)-pyrimidinone 5'-phosphate reductase n=1 Tax=Cryoendolithus antarcticus TaxID=1507870 RepID=A0A1V8TUD5_9PEZI|nr:hypothetical protein B0A48_00315 [Cryoendolithus antarcticus]